MSEQYRCGICHASVIPNKEIEISKKTKTYLDFIPKENSIEYIDSQLEFCDNCGFVGYEIDNLYSKEDLSKIRNVMFSQEYINIFCNKNINPTEKKLLLASILDREFGLILDINFLLFEYYDLTDESQKAKIYALKEIRRLENKINRYLNIKTRDRQNSLFTALHSACIAIDLCRRISDFERAEKIINLYKDFHYHDFKEEMKFISCNYKKIISTEKRLCKEKDNSRI